MRLESIIQLIQSMPSGKSVQRSARLLGVFALMIVSLNGFAAADDAADAAGIITPCDPFMDPNCVGKVELRDGRQFEGRLVDGQPTGQGVMVFQMAVDLKAISKVACRWVEGPIILVMAAPIPVFGYVTGSMVR